MKRIVVASLAAAGLASATSINAADIAPSVPAAVPVYVVAPPYSWTGFYLGGHAGGARVEDRATTVGANG